MFRRSNSDILYCKNLYFTHAYYKNGQYNFLQFNYIVNFMGKAEIYNS